MYLGTEGDLNGVGEFFNTLKDTSTAFVSKLDFLGSESSGLEDFPCLQVNELFGI